MTRRAQPPSDPLPEDRMLLAAGRLHDPFRLLGRHPTGAERVVVRAFLPGASRAWIVENGEELTRFDDGDFFEWAGSPTGLPDRYRVGVEEDGLERVEFDPYAFPPQLHEAAIASFSRGEHFRSHDLLGSRLHTADSVSGVLFALWAPEAERVSVVGGFNRWDGRRHPMRARGSSGVWELFLPGLADGELYKYEIRNRASGSVFLKSDPFGRASEHRPGTASIVPGPSRFTWSDSEWLESRETWNWAESPVSVYEMHAGSWRRSPSGGFLSYREIADQLVPEIRELGFTHVEFLPLTEHPLDGSWGYQPTGYFAPTRRHGSADDLKYLVDTLHRNGIGVILDWVPGHFPKDSHGLARFDGSALFEYGEADKGEHREWGTLVFNYGRNEVRSFLMSSALYWLEEFHVDGLRVDAVASMLYLDYSRPAGQWRPNIYGGNENLEATAFLKRFNEETHGQFPGTVTIAEESTAWPGVTRPTWANGLGFSMKWNMGWMHDTLEYVSEDPIHRKYHHNRITFAPMYAFSENFVLPLSHDEVVHGKRSLLGRMPGDPWQQFANLRLLYTLQWTFPGKKLLFMGSELGQPQEWDHARALPWDLIADPRHRGVRRLVCDLNALYRRNRALHVRDFSEEGFEWLRWDDADNSVISYQRKDGEDRAIVLINFTPVPRHNYRIGMDRPGQYREILNSDSRFYGGSDVGNPVPLSAGERGWMGRPYSFEVTLPPLGAVVLQPETRSPDGTPEPPPISAEP
jgi:1,4-alpha-glucan branching enzyme